MPFHEVKTAADLEKVFGAAGGHLIVLDFSATWCGPCRAIAPFFHDLSNNADYANVHFVHIDVDESPDLAEAYQVEAMPTFVYVKDKKPVDRLLGASKPELTNKLNSHK